MARNILKSSVQNASFNIIIQIIFRCITFLLNAFIIRTVGQDVLGIMNVRLLLLESTILFLSKEPLSKACLTDTRSHNWAQVINQAWLSVPACAILSSILVYVWINILVPTDEIYMSQYILGCYAIGLSCILEQSTQIVMLVAQSFCFVKLKVIIETVYILSRTVIFLYYVLKKPDEAINAFSIAQITSSVIFCLSYYGFFFWYIRRLNKEKELNQKDKISNKLFADMDDFPFTSVCDFLPGLMPNKEGLVNKKLCLLTLSFIKQSVVKQILTEGEKYVMTISPVLTFSQQSMYDIVNNLGSLAARFIFRPIEESAYFYFTQMIKRDLPLSKQDKKQVAESAEVLSQLCKIVFNIGLIVVTFGQSYSYSFLYLYGGNKLVSDELSVTLLRFHSFAVVLLAINGITEGYVFATMNNQQIDKYNYLMVIFSATFLGISYFLTNLIGPLGFILANCVNMSARICHSIIYISKKYSDTKFEPLKGFYPGIKFVLALLVSGLATHISELYLLRKSMLLHITVGAVFFFLTLAVWAIENKQLLLSNYSKYKRRASIKKSD